MIHSIQLRRLFVIWPAWQTRSVPIRRHRSHLSEHHSSQAFSHNRPTHSILVNMPSSNYNIASNCIHLLNRILNLLNYYSRSGWNDTQSTPNNNNLIYDSNLYGTLQYSNGTAQNQQGLSITSQSNGYNSKSNSYGGATSVSSSNQYGSQNLQQQYSPSNFQTAYSTSSSNASGNNNFWWSKFQQQQQYQQQQPQHQSSPTPNGSVASYYSFKLSKDLIILWFG